MYNLIRFGLWNLLSNWKRVVVVVALSICAFAIYNYFWGGPAEGGEDVASAAVDAPTSSEVAQIQRARAATATMSLHRLDDVYAGLSEAALSIPAPQSQTVYYVDYFSDGDSFVTTDGRRIRMYGIDTPERGEACYYVAKWELAEQLANGFRVESGPRAIDPYGRDLYYLYTVDGESVDLHMVAAGYAKAFTRDGQHLAVIDEAQTLARRYNVGCLWAR